MKKTKIFTAIGGISLFVLSIFLISSDHIDAPNVSGTSTDIADFYAFEGDDPSNTVFIATLQGILTPGLVTENATFDEDVLIEFNIDNTGDFVEDLVIQVIKRDSIMYFFGPTAPVSTGLESNILTSADRYSVEISTIEELHTTNENGMSFFAGPRRDAFYFDFNKYNDIASGDEAPAGFSPPGEAEDFFNDLNTLAIVVEVPNSLLGTPPEHILGTEGNISGLPPSYNVWVSAKRKE
mgnify:CR=1 FL=1